MTKIEYNGRITTRENIQTETEDKESKKVRAVITTDIGDKITFMAGQEWNEGFSPAMEVKVTIKALNKTLDETG